MDDVELNGPAADDQARSTAHPRARAHVQEAQVRLVRPPLRREPLQEGHKRLAGRGVQFNTLKNCHKTPFKKVQSILPWVQ